MLETRPIDMQALSIFIATAQDCNMSRAAERLSISQSAVSQSIRLLEENLGSPLLNRSTRPMTLTPAGNALLEKGRVLLEDVLNLRGAVIEASRGIKPSLRIGLVDSFAATCGTLLAQRLLHNTAQLSVRTGLTPNLGIALAQRELDLVISTRSLGIDGVVNHVLMSERFFVIAPKKSMPVCHSVEDVRMLARSLPIVRFNRQSHLGEQVEPALRGMGLNPPRHLEMDTADTLTAMVAGGIGWAITTPLCLLQGARSATAVRHDFIHGLNAERKVYLHVRKDEYGSVGRETFDIVHAILQDHIARELTEINPLLPNLIQIEPWNDNA